MFAHLDAGGGVTTSWAWLSTLAYTLHIYFDFSGYSDMAIGLALLFGIRLPVNFRSPYKATSIVDFWRRWHITAIALSCATISTFRLVAIAMGNRAATST